MATGSEKHCSTLVLFCFEGVGGGVGKGGGGGVGVGGLGGSRGNMFTECQHDRLFVLVRPYEDTRSGSQICQIGQIIHGCIDSLAISILFSCPNSINIMIEIFCI